MGLTTKPVGSVLAPRPKMNWVVEHPACVGEFGKTNNMNINICDNPPKRG